MQESSEEVRAEGLGWRPYVDSSEPPPRDSRARTRDGLAVGGEGKGLIIGSKVKQPHWTRSIYGREVTSSILNVLTFLIGMGEDRKSRA